VGTAPHQTCGSKLKTASGANEGEQYASFAWSEGKTTSAILGLTREDDGESDPADHSEPEIVRQRKHPWRCHVVVTRQSKPGEFGKAPMMNNAHREVIPSRTAQGSVFKMDGSAEGVETRFVTPKNKRIHERPAPQYIEGEEIVRTSSESWSAAQTAATVEVISTAHKRKSRVDQPAGGRTTGVDLVGRPGAVTPQYKNRVKTTDLQRSAAKALLSSEPTPCQAEGNDEVGTSEGVEASR
jgi:hypothetical protein